MNKSATEIHRILQEVYGDHASVEQMQHKWFVRLKSGDFDLKDKNQPGQLNNFADADLEAMLDKDSCQMQ